jgi:virginiamycin B lyase
VKKKGLIVAIFFGTIMLTSLSAGVLLNNQPISQQEEITKTGTPADNFPDSQRAQFCGSSIAKSTKFIQEYSIPTDCTNPLAVVTDYSGNVWFAETNTGKLGKFDPITESFIEFENPLWPKNGRSMIWGIDYSPDGSVWYTDESYDSIWKFSTDDKKYQRIDFPSEGDSLPQKLKILGSQVVVNDFNGNKLTFLDPTQSNKELSYLNIPSPVEGSVTGDFAIDTKNNVWYTNWIFQQGGVLVKFDQDAYRNSIATSNQNSLQSLDFIQVFQLPVDLFTPNGIAVTDGMIWIADTSNSAIFTFNPDTNQFISYPTSDPKISTYGNSTGVIKDPISRPYWIEANSAGQLVFNEQTANSIAVLDPKTDSLVEYLIPPKNPAWGDCDLNFNCGLAQVFDFAIYKDKIWFTEWVENKIGVVDTSVPLPFDVSIDTQDISLLIGESKNISLTITPQSTVNENVSLILSDYVTFLDATSDSHSFQLNSPKTIDVKISASDEASIGTYKVLVGAQIEDVSISKFVTVTILP